MFWSLILIVMFCELGQRFTSQFDRIDLETLSLHWYTFPYEVQTILPIIIIGTQKPVEFVGFCNIRCTRETLKNVRLLFT